MSKIREKESLECGRMHIWALRTQKLPGPLSGPWTPAANCSLHSRDSTSLRRQLSASAPGAPPLTKSWIRTWWNWLSLLDLIVSVLRLISCISHISNISSFEFLPETVNQIRAHLAARPFDALFDLCRDINWFNKTDEEIRHLRVFCSTRTRQS